MKRYVHDYQLLMSFRIKYDDSLKNNKSETMHVKWVFFVFRDKQNKTMH